MLNQPLSDHKIVSRLQKSDEKVFKHLFDEHYKTLVISANQILQDESASKDAAQEVFIQLWKSREKLSDKMHFASYLKRGVINRAINILKSRRHHMGSGDAALSFVKTKEHNPQDVLEGNDLKKVIYTAIDQMPDKCREVFILCRIDQRPHKEIAALLDISTKTIENQMTKALKILKKAVEEYRSRTLIILFFILI